MLVLCVAMVFVQLGHSLTPGPSFIWVAGWEDGVNNPIHLQQATIPTGQAPSGGFSQPFCSDWDGDNDIDCVLANQGPAQYDPIQVPFLLSTLASQPPSPSRARPSGLLTGAFQGWHL